MHPQHPSLCGLKKFSYKQCIHLQNWSTNPEAISSSADSYLNKDNPKNVSTTAGPIFHSSLFFAFWPSLSPMSISTWYYSLIFFVFFVIWLWHKRRFKFNFVLTKHPTCGRFKSEFWFKQNIYFPSRILLKLNITAGFPLLLANACRSTSIFGSFNDLQ